MYKNIRQESRLERIVRRKDENNKKYSSGLSEETAHAVEGGRTHEVNLLEKYGGENT